MQTIGSADSVVAAIRDDAAGELERIEKAAAAEIDRLKSGAAAFSEPKDDGGLKSAATRRNAENAAQAEWDGQRRFIEQRERWIAEVIAHAAPILAGTGDGDLARLESEARAVAGEGTCERAPSGGCILRGRTLVFDNSFSERARRYEPYWRKALAEIYRP